MTATSPRESPTAALASWTHTTGTITPTLGERLQSAPRLDGERGAGTRPALNAVFAREQPSDEIVSIYRGRLHASLAKAAEVMSRNDMLTTMRGDNTFRFGKDVPPPAEGAALWAEFNVETDCSTPS